MKALIQIVLAMRYNELLVKSSAKDSRTWLLKFRNFEDTFLAVQSRQSLWTAQYFVTDSLTDN